MNQAQHRRWIVAGILVAIASAVTWGDLDWNVLAAPGRALFHAGGLHIYANDPSLKDGPAVVLVYAGLGRLGQDAGAVISHLAMWALFGWALYAAGRHDTRSRPNHDPRIVQLPRGAIIVVAALPVLVWNMPPFTAPEAMLWGAAVVTGLALLALPRSGAWLRCRAKLSRVELFGLLMIGSWALLAAGTAHLEDAAAITLIIWSAGVAEERGSSVRPAIAVGIAMAFKPWAVAGVGVLLRRDRPSMMVRDLSIAGGIVVAAWLPFLLVPGAAHATAQNHFGYFAGSPLSLIVPSTSTPTSARTMQLAGILIASVVIRRAGRYESVAAAMCVRMLLEPGTYVYYLSSLLFAVGAADLATGRGPRRVLIATAGTWLVPCLVTDLRAVAAVKALTLIGVLGSYLWPGLRSNRCLSPSRRPARSQCPLRERRRASPE